MFGRKKYRKGVEYLYFVSGVKKTAGQDSTFMNSNTITPINNLNAVEMRNEVFDVVKKMVGVSENDSFAFTGYWIERV